MFNPKVLETRLAELMKELATFYGLLLQRNFNRRKAFIAFTTDRKCCNFYDLWDDGSSTLEKLASDLGEKQSHIAFMFQIFYWRLIQEKYAFIAYTDDGKEYQFFDLAEKITDMRVITKNECGHCRKLATEEEPLSVVCLMCDKAAYCNKLCQKEDWLAHHYRFCHYIRKPPTDNQNTEQPSPFRAHCESCQTPQSESVKLKPCLVCHEAYYCSRECQITDLEPFHRHYCEYRRDFFSTKKKPTAFRAKQEWLPGCYGCGKTNVSLHNCGRCGIVSYCTTECQKQDWQQRHKYQCKLMADYYGK